MSLFKKTHWTALLLGITIGLSSVSPTNASDDQRSIFGSQLMTERERMEHREQMRNASSDEEREQIRNEHHERMKLRAQQRGIELPDEPQARGRQRMQDGTRSGRMPGTNDRGPSRRRGS